MKTIAIMALLQIASISVAGEGLRLHVSLPRSTLSAGESVRPRAILVNAGDAAVVLVLPGDGSRQGWRTPRVGFSAIPLAGAETHPGEVPLSEFRSCGNINPIRSSEVFRLEPGERRNIERWMPFLQLREPGMYRVVFYYQNVPDLRIRGVLLGLGHEPGVEEAMRGSAPVFLVSNELLVEVLESADEGVGADSGKAVAESAPAGAPQP